MKRISLLLVTLVLAACNGDKLTGASAQNAAVRYQNTAPTSSIRPLIFVDGKEVSWDYVRAMDTKTIESVEVLKGAAIPKAMKVYGDRARDGVILVETKR